MKKIFLSLIASVVGVMGASAQSSMLATLTHEGTVSTFYGANALRDAHSAAASGDVITLSSGTFISTDITKAVTIRGAGMDVDAKMQREPTVISGDFKINIPDSAGRMTLEGIYSNHTITYNNVKNAMFMKCRLKEITGNGSFILKDASFIHCRIANKLYLNRNCSASCINCVIEDPRSGDGSTANFEFMNCVIKYNDVYTTDTYSSSFKNCIIWGRSDYYGQINENCTAYNCIGLYDRTFENITNSTNTIVSDIATLFKTYKGEPLEKLDSETFELTDDAKAKYLGMDGATEVGIYGGSLPFDPTPSNPQITKCNVAAKSTADGKLSVDIQVGAAE